MAVNSASPSPRGGSSPSRRAHDQPFVVEQLSPVPVNLFDICSQTGLRLDTILASMHAHGFALPPAKPFGNCAFGILISS